MKENVKISDTKTFNENAFKQYLVKCFSLLEDLKKISDDDVKKYIFNQLYSNLSLIELGVYGIFQNNHSLEDTIKYKDASISKLNTLHDLQINAINASRIEELQQIAESKRENELDQEMKKKFDFIGSETANTEIPEYEQKAYKDYLNNTYYSDKTDVETDDEKPLTLEECLYPVQNNIKIENNQKTLRSLSSEKNDKLNIKDQNKSDKKQVKKSKKSYKKKDVLQK